MGSQRRQFHQLPKLALRSAAPLGKAITTDGLMAASGWMIPSMRSLAYSAFLPPLVVRRVIRERLRGVFADELVAGSGLMSEQSCKGLARKSPRPGDLQSPSRAGRRFVFTLNAGTEVRPHNRRSPSGNAEIRSADSCRLGSGAMAPGAGYDQGRRQFRQALASVLWHLWLGDRIGGGGQMAGRTRPRRRPDRPARRRISSPPG